MGDDKRNKVVFVCSGNICRSPMGEALLKHAVAATDANDPVRKLEICSAGVSTVDGMLPSAHSIEALAKVGIDISGYRSTAMTQKCADGAFAIFPRWTRRISTRSKPLPQPSRTPVQGARFKRKGEIQRRVRPLRRQLGGLYRSARRNSLGNTLNFKIPAK